MQKSIAKQCFSEIWVQGRKVLAGCRGGAPAGERGSTPPHPASPSLLGSLLFAEVCLLAAVAGILAWRAPAPGLLLLALTVWLDKPRSLRPGLTFCLAAAFAAAFCYTALREHYPPPVPEWLADAAFIGEPAFNDPGSGDLKPPGPIPVRAEVAEITPLPGNRIRIILEGLRPADESGTVYAGRAVWTWYTPAFTPVPGQTIETELRLAEQHAMANPGVWDTDRYWHNRNVWFRAYTKNKAEVAVRDKSGNRLLFDAGRLRQGLHERFLARLPTAQGGRPEPGSGASLLPALIFGDRSLLTPELADRFARATLAHSLALSGMHLGFAVLAGFAAAWLLGRVWPGLWLYVTRPLGALLLSLPFAGLYLWLGGAPVSLMRAACMLGFWTLLLLFKRPRVLLDGLCAAVALLLLVNPLALFDIGLQLSALSVAAIALALPRMHGRVDRWVHGAASRLCAADEETRRQNRAGTYSVARRMARSALVLVGLSLVIQIALLPLVTRIFGTSGLLFPLNLIWLPVLGSVVLPLAFAGLAFTAAGLDGLASFSLHAATLPCDALLWLLERLDAAGWLVSPPMPRPHWLSIAGYWLLCVALPGLAGGALNRSAAPASAVVDGLTAARTTRPQSLSDSHTMRPWKAWLPACVLGLAMLLGPPIQALVTQTRDRVAITLLDVGQGQAVLIEWGGQTPGRLLVDGGGFASPYFDVGKAIVAPALTDNALPKLEAVIASHPDTDHLGGLLFILERFSVGRYFGNGMDALPALTAREGAALESGRLSREILRAGDRLALTPDLTLETLWPTPQALQSMTGGAPGQEKSNDASLVQRLVWKGEPLLLLCGDAEHNALARIVEENGEALRARVLVLPHHGSAGSRAPGFYETVGPDLALVSSGFGNRWGFPALKVRQDLEELGIPLLNTAFAGQIRLEWAAPGRFEVFTARERR